MATIVRPSALAQRGRLSDQTGTVGGPPVQEVLSHKQSRAYGVNYLRYITARAAKAT